MNDLSQTKPIKEHLNRVEISKLNPDEREQVVLFQDLMDRNPFSPSAAGYFEYNRGMLISVSFYRICNETVPSVIFDIHRRDFGRP